MVTDSGIDLDFPMFPSLLLIEGKGFSKNLFPSKREEVGDTETEEAAAGDKETHPIIPILIEPTNEIQHRVPRKIIRSCITIFCTHILNISYIYNTNIRVYSEYTKYILNFYVNFA